MEKVCIGIVGIGNMGSAHANNIFAGKVTGLDEQIKTLKESKPFLFKQEEKPKLNNKRGFFPLGPKENGGEGGETKMTMKEAIAAKLNLAEGKGE